MQPLLTTTIRRPFHWGIVVVAVEPPTGDIPAVVGDTLVVANAHSLIILVRHAQDIESLDGEYDFAEAEVTVRQMVGPMSSPASGRVVYEGVLDVPSGRLSVGDADDWVILPAHHGANTAVVSVEAGVPADELSPDAVHVDLWPG